VRALPLSGAGRPRVKFLLAAIAVLLAAIAVFFAAPATAVAAPSVAARDLSVRSGLVAQAPNAFDLVGLHWKGSGVVRFRTQRADGAWSKWRLSAPEGDDLPDRNTAEAKRSRGWHLGNPYRKATLRHTPIV